MEMNETKDRLTSFAVAATCIFLPSLPVTHSLGLFAHCPKSAKARHVMLYPFKGGRHHTIFQVISWVVWGASVLIALPVMIKYRRMQRPETHAEVLAAAAAIGSVFAELFMIQSLLVFDPQTRGMASNEPPGSPAYSRKAVPSKPMAGTMVVAMGALWVGMAGALVWATEYLENIATKQAYILSSGACLLVGIMTTHGLGGKLWHTQSSNEDGLVAWRFFQPFKGGAAFVATQALGWGLFSAALTSLFWVIAQLAAGMAYCMRCWALGTCSAMGAAYLVLGASIWVFQGPHKAKETLQAAKVAVRELPHDIVPWSTVWLPILALYTPVHIFSCIVAFTFLTLPTTYTAAFWVGSLVLYYAITSQDQPQHTGSREWPLIKRWLSSTLASALQAWFGKVEVVYVGKKALDKSHRYIFGYAPHGLFPIGAPYMTLLPQFRKLFPSIDPAPLVASVCFFTPVVRDLCSWCGLRQVSRPTFIRALDEKGSVLLVPGGQAELVHTHRFFTQKECVIYTQHKGFVRLAIQQNAALVPVFCFGEIAALRNFFDWPAMQQWTYKIIGFPIPYLVVGRWRITPFPRRTQLKFVVGEPLFPPTPSHGNEVKEEDVALLHKQYYAAISELFHQHRRGFPGYEDVRLKLI